MHMCIIMYIYTYIYILKYVNIMLPVAAAVGATQFTNPK